MSTYVRNAICSVCGGSVMTRAPYSERAKHADLEVCVSTLTSTIDDLEGDIGDLKSRLDDSKQEIAELFALVKNLTEKQAKDYKHLHNMANAAAYGI